MMTPEEARTPFREQFRAMAPQFPVDAFPHLCEALPYAAEFFDRGFDFGIRALARGLIAEAKSGHS